MTQQQQQENTETVIDLVEIPFVPRRHLRTSAIDKMKMNDDHSFIAFTVDINNNEKLTAGVKDM